ncbi:hypothetical protein M011DRAFT_351170 [Sporormia fimetaria CBS 119925]|uniref:Heterokaryon incompatibility domain-containing protein n=1 Tax=Sporormia fimetaria CBS 119925 TaxID=1340428 RepID=A0A6A6VFC7_9PLEO|nr:hypothetical protein M011DRAFT_351170 [Sporormia fimetaria CBS 119925]
MDMLPIPGSSFPGLETPLLDASQHTFHDRSSQSLDRFLSHEGFNKAELIDPKTPPPRAATLLQSWLFFGVLSQALRVRIKAVDFGVPTSNGHFQRRITLSPLPSMLKETSYYEEADRSKLQHRRTLLETAFQYLKEIEAGPLHTLANKSIVAVTLSIRVLYSTLIAYDGGPDLELLPHPLIAKRLEDQDWCPSHIRRIMADQNTLLACYLMRVRRPNPRGYSHSRCPGTHCVATNTKLLGGYVTQHTHRKPEDCPFIAVGNKEVRSIIAKGGIPLVSIRIPSSGKHGIELRVRQATAEDKYVAISHVWADGLGNSKSNSLPACQLRRLSDYLTRLPNPTCKKFENNARDQLVFGPLSVRSPSSGPGVTWERPNSTRLFWMDTLCIPVAGDKGKADQEAAQLKVKAINMMADIYGRASHVLVLDSTLQECRIANMQRSERLAHILFSPWMGRSWTLQEGALNRHVYFQFSDGAYNVNDLVPNDGQPLTNNDWYPARFVRLSLGESMKSFMWAWKSSRNSSKRTDETVAVVANFESFIFKTLHRKCIQALHRSGLDTPKNRAYQWKSALSPFEAQWVQRFVCVWNGLSTRTTTMEDDLPAIFSNLLDLDTETILSLPPSERLGAIVRAGPALPLSLLCIPCPRLGVNDKRKSRWVPRSLLRVPLEEEPAFSLDDKQRLVLKHKDIRTVMRPLLLVPLKPLIPSEEMVLQYSGSRWKITSHREPNDVFAEHRKDHIGFIISGNEELRARHLQPIEACCVRIVRHTSSQQIEAVYDCACTAVMLQEANGPAKASKSDVQVREETDWTLTILPGASESPVLLRCEEPPPRSRITRKLSNLWPYI